MINTLNDLKHYLSDNKLIKIFLLCGNNSFSNSGARGFIDNNLKNKKTKFF